MTSDTELFAEDGTDLCYVKDCAKAIALLQVAPTLNHTIYNIGGGASTTYADVVASIRRCIPSFVAQLLPGSSSFEQPANAFLDLRWLREDIGYKPDYSLDEGIAEYVDWLQAGHDL